MTFMVFAILFLCLIVYSRPMSFLGVVYFFYSFLVIDKSIGMGSFQLSLNYLFLLGIFSVALIRNYRWVKKIPDYLISNKYLTYYILTYIGLLVFMNVYHLLIWGELPIRFLRIYFFSLWGPALCLLLVPDWDPNKFVKYTLGAFLLSFLAVGPSAFVFFFMNKGASLWRYPLESFGIDPSPYSLGLSFGDESLTLNLFEEAETVSYMVLMGIAVYFLIRLLFKTDSKRYLFLSYICLTMLGFLSDVVNELKLTTLFGFQILVSTGLFLWANKWQQIFIKRFKLLGFTIFTIWMLTQINYFGGMWPQIYNFGGMWPPNSSTNEFDFFGREERKAYHYKDRFYVELGNNMATCDDYLLTGMNIVPPRSFELRCVVERMLKEYPITGSGFPDYQNKIPISKKLPGTFQGGTIGFEQILISFGLPVGLFIEIFFLGSICLLFWLNRNYSLLGELPSNLIIVGVLSSEFQKAFTIWSFTTHNIAIPHILLVSLILSFYQNMKSKENFRLNSENS